MENNVLECENNFVSLVSDSTYKYLWKNEKTRKWMNDIIKAKVGIDLTYYDIIDNEQNTGSALKDYRSDVVLSNKKDIVIIEMNGAYSEIIENKGRAYLYRRAGNLFLEGENYIKNDNVTLIMFNNYYNKLDKNVKVINYWFGNHENTKHKIKFDEIEMFEIHLPTFKEKCYTNCSDIDKRLWLFGAESFQEMDDNVKDDSNRFIVDELKRLSMNNEFIDEYDREKVNKKIWRSFEMQGFEQGKKENSIEIAKNLLNLNTPIDTIIKATGLEKEELDKIR